MSKQFLHRYMKRLKPFFLYGRGSFIAKFIYRSIISFELSLQSLIDLIKATKQLDNLSQLTVVIKTFERPKELNRLIKSIRRFYPNLKIVVVDDSKVPMDIDGVNVIKMPFDSGVSAGRNRALEVIDTEFLLLLDDDFIFNRHTLVHLAMKTMIKNPCIDIMGGNVIDLPLFIEHDYTKSSNLFPTDAKPNLPLGTNIAGLPVYNKVPNFFIARTERIKLVKWDERLKKIEHADFFTRAVGMLTTVFNENLKVLHSKTPFNSNYMKYRNDFQVEQILLREKYYSKNK